MTGRTHDLAAFTALNLVVATQVIPDLSLGTAIVAFGVCLLGGLAPDIDKPTSEFWQKIPAGTLFGKLLHPFIGSHRHFSHSLVGLALFGWGAKELLQLTNQTILVNMDIVWWGFMIGLISHFFADALTHEGIPLLFPIPLHFGFPPFKMLRVKTGGLLEKILVFPALLIANGYLFYHFSNIYLQFLRNFIK